MDTIIQKIQNCREIEKALDILYENISKTELIEKSYEKAKKFHDGITRKSGEPYLVHPILVATLTAHFNGTKEMVCAALLHDVVEDTECNIEDIELEFGSVISVMVDGLTKINSDEKSFTAALSFGKLLEYSKKSPEILIIKLCDRVHNMLTLDSLSDDKKARIAEETLNIYAGVAHKLGISVIKNALEDLSFQYLQTNDYQKIDTFIKSHSQDLHLKLNIFIEKVTKYLFDSGFKKDDFFIEKRIKHHYSTFLKMQRKGISIDEVTDLLAIRIIVKEKIDCYKALGALHIHMMPLISRFKDYVANPKDNGYQTIHTMFFFDGSILEAQIRTEDMHKIAEQGIAAHWKYKGKDIKTPDLSWLNDINYHDRVDKELALSEYKDAQSILYKNEILVYSKDGHRFHLPAGSKVLDFAYEIHTEIGERADKAYVNEHRVNLLTPLKTGDRIKIELSTEPHFKCSWINDLMTIKAKKALRQACKNKQREIDTKVGKEILREIFKVDKRTIIDWLKEENLLDDIYKLAIDSQYLFDTVLSLRKYAPSSTFNPFLGAKKFVPLKQKFTNIVIYSNQIFKDVRFDYCCHPKRGDEIIGFRDKNDVVVHHKMCKDAMELMEYDEPMVFVKWTKDKPDSYILIFTLENKVAALSNFLKILAINGVNLVQINSENNTELGTIFFNAVIEKRDSNFIELKNIIEKSCKLVEFRKYEDAYKK